MHGRIPAVPVEFDSDKMPVCTPGPMANNSREVSIAVGESQWGTDRKGAADNHAHSVQRQIFDVSELLQHRAVSIPRHHDQFSIEKSWLRPPFHPSLALQRCAPRPHLFSGLRLKEACDLGSGVLQTKGRLKEWHLRQRVSTRSSTPNTFG